MRRRQLFTLGAIVFFCFCVFSILKITPEGAHRFQDFTSPPEPQEPHEPPQWVEPPVVTGGPKPKAVRDTSSHPVWALVNDAKREFEATTKKQSKSLKGAVLEYRRRYGLPPPPHFDKWFEFAQKNKVRMVDEFDTVYNLITPFWGLKPKTIRARAKEALGFDNALVGVAIRNGAVTYMQGGQEWQRNATEGMMAKFINYLPDMDLAFNIHDEPRVILPHEDLTRLVHKAKTENMPAANARPALTNEFSRAVDMNNGLSFEETKLTRFNIFAHQATWTNSRMSCPPDSPARRLEEDQRTDDLSKYGLSDAGFVYNSTAMADICLTPSLSSTYGFFDRPNAYNVVHDLFPIFSQSKISSYSDIIYPSPWYWAGKVIYEEERDMPFAKKNSSLYWRGSTTGGYSREGGWRRQHRQRFVQKINAANNAKIFIDQSAASSPSSSSSLTSRWEAKDSPRGDFKKLIDVHFSHVGQCDPGDCQAQHEFFDVTERVESQDAWGWKYLLDMDGNAFSGRFYSFLESFSLVFKLTIFHEWHAEWLRPWAHYVPLSLQGDDWLEAVRFFSDEELGAAEGEKMAGVSREWARQAVRKEDMEAWFFRLLLEYGRVIDDNRESIGYDPSKGS